jgi:hypothetical protein
MSNVLELLSHNELIVRKNHLLKQLEKIDLQLEKIKKKENEIISNNEITPPVIIKPITEKKHISIKLKKDNSKIILENTETNVIKKNIKIKINVKKI